MASACLIYASLPAAFAGAFGALWFASQLFSVHETSIYASVELDAPTQHAEHTQRTLPTRRQLVRARGAMSAGGSAANHRTLPLPSQPIARPPAVQPTNVTTLQLHRSMPQPHTAPVPHREVRSPRSALPRMVDVCFLALGPSTQIDYSTSIIRNIEAQSARRGSVRYHLLVDRSPSHLRAQMHLREAWRGVPKRRVFMHTVADISADAKALYRALSRTATGPGPIYLYKPLLHLVLPTWLSHVIVLDTDLFLFSDIAGLWEEFAHFEPTQLLGLAAEQCPSYQEVRALGGMGLNGGVQLLALSRMRTSRAYAKLISAYTVKPMRHPMKPGGIGWLGDQTLYSWMSVNGTGARDLFHLIPCGWNRQIGTHMAGWPHFWERHRCATPCHLLHGNYVGHKKLMESLKADPTGQSCVATVRRYRQTERAFRPGTADARMLNVIERTCCRTASNAGAGAVGATDNGVMATRRATAGRRGRRDRAVARASA